MDIADIVTLLFCLIAIIVPRLLQQLQPRVNSGIVIGGMFICSIAGGYVYKFMTGQPGIAAFGRVFFISGLSHLIIYAVYQEMYRRLEIRQIQIDHEVEEEKTP